MKILGPVLAIIIPIVLMFGVMYRLAEYKQKVNQRDYNTSLEIDYLKTRIGVVESLQTQEVEQMTVKIVCIHEVCQGLSENINCINKCISNYNLSK